MGPRHLATGLVAALLLPLALPAPLAAQKKQRSAAIESARAGLAEIDAALRSGDRDRAGRLAREVERLAVREDDLDALATVGRVHAMLGDTASAERAWETALGIAPQQKAALLLWTELLARQQNAAVALEKVEAARGADAEAFDADLDLVGRYAELLGLAGRHEEAAGVLVPVLYRGDLTDQQRFVIGVRTAQAFERGGDKGSAATAAERAIIDSGTTDLKIAQYVAVMLFQEKEYAALWRRVLAADAPLAKAFDATPQAKAAYAQLVAAVKGQLERELGAVPVRFLAFRAAPADAELRQSLADAVVDVVKSLDETEDHWAALLPEGSYGTHDIQRSVEAVRVADHQGFKRADAAEDRVSAMTAAAAERRERHLATVAEQPSYSVYTMLAEDAIATRDWEAARTYQAVAEVLEAAAWRDSVYESLMDVAFNFDADSRALAKKSITDLDRIASGNATDAEAKLIALTATASPHELLEAALGIREIYACVGDVQRVVVPEEPLFSWLDNVASALVKRWHETHKHAIGEAVVRALGDAIQAGQRREDVIGLTRAFRNGDEATAVALARYDAAFATQHLDDTRLQSLLRNGCAAPVVVDAAIARFATEERQGSPEQAAELAALLANLAYIDPRTKLNLVVYNHPSFVAARAPYDLTASSALSRAFDGEKVTVLSGWLQVVNKLHARRAGSSWPYDGWLLIAACERILMQPGEENNAGVTALLGLTYFDVGEPAAAIGHLERAFGKPSKPFHPSHIALVLAKARRGAGEGDAFAAIDAAVERAVANDVAINAIIAHQTAAQWLLDDGQPDAALARLGAALELDPRQPVTLRVLAELLMEMKRYAEAGERAATLVEVATEMDNLGLKLRALQMQQDAVVKQFDESFGED